MFDDVEPVVRLNGIWKSFGKKNVLKNLNLTVRENEVVGLLGPNGAGKTTLMRIIARYLLPDAGTLNFRKDQFLTERSHNVVGYLPEKAPLFDSFTVERYVRLVAVLKAVPQDLVSEKVGEVLNAFDLRHVSRNVISKLSKGYRQRVGLAQAFLGDSALLILDEPMSGLDPFQLADVRDMILEAANKRAILFSTHVVQEIEVLCNRSIFLKDGVLLEVSGEADDSALIEVCVGVPDIDHLKSLINTASGECIVESKSIGGGKYKLRLQISSAQKPEMSKLLANNGELMSFREANLDLEARLTSLREKAP